MPRKADHLQFHGGSWRVVLAVPKDVRDLPPFNGKAYLIQRLGTADLNRANGLKGAWLSKWRTDIAAARRPGDPVDKQAELHLRQLEGARDDIEEMDAHLGAALAADRVEEHVGPAAGQRFYAVATGLATPLDFYLDDWVADQEYTGKTVLQHKKAFTDLAQWCQSKGVPTTVQAITSHVVWDFIEKHLKPNLGTLKTTNRYLSSYRTHWAWLQRRRRVDTNPWDNTHLTTKPRRGGVIDADRDEGKRPFTDDEVRLLMTGPAPEPLPDLILVGALTGARINAICELRVRDCRDQTFVIQPAKQEPRARIVPIHPDLWALVARRMEGKADNDFLFHECPKATKERPRSAAASQAFTRYRRALKIDERPNGKRQSNVDFHSLRRWFTTKAEQAGQPPHIIDAVTGHKRPGETLGRYSKGPSLEQLRACVEAVNLPKGHESE